MKITKGTIIRTIIIGIVLINLFLKQIGKPIIEVEEGSITSLVELLIEAAAIVVAWWKNNSFTESARKADEFLKKLKVQTNRKNSKKN